MAGIKGNKVSLKTFLSWKQDVIGYEKEEIDKKDYIVKVWCRLCAKHATVVRRRSTLKGSATKSLDAFINGTTSVTKFQVMRHLDGDMHKISVEEEGRLPTQEQLVEVPVCRQPRIETSIRTSANECYRRMLVTAYQLAINPSLPLKSFNLLINCQRKNGVQMIKGCDDGRAAKEFISSLAEAVKSKCEKIVRDAPFFSLLSDGSQARKTQEDKELLLARVVRNGLPTYLLIDLLNMSDFGGTDANSIKDAIDAAFDDTAGRIKLSEEQYRRKLISATADGASVNMGAHRGVLTQLEETRDWLVKIHCVNHRVELAAKKTVNNSVYSEVETLYLTIYFFLRNSGRFKSECKELAEAREVDYKELPKIHGTRFLGHKRAGVTSLLLNWAIFKEACENAVAFQGPRKYQALTRAKINGMLHQFSDYRLLTLAATYLDLLDKATPISKVFEAKMLLPSDVAISVKRTILELQELSDEAGTPDERIDSHMSRFVLQEDEDGHFIEYERLARGNARKKPENRNNVMLRVSGLKHANEATSAAASNHKKLVALEWIAVIQERFGEFESDQLYQDMQWLDRSYWSDEGSYGDNQILNIAAHFDSPLNYAGFDVHSVIKEWKSCKKLIRARYPNPETSNSDIWRYVLTKERKVYPNLCLVVQLLFSISVSNSTVERAFSILTMMMSDRRLNLTHDILTNIMLIKCNDPNWSEGEKEDLIDHAVGIYTSKRRRKQVDEESCSQKRKADEISSTVEEVESDDSDYDLDIEDIVI